MSLSPSTDADFLSDAPRSRRNAWAGVVLFYIALTIALCWPVLAAINRAVPADIGDPILNTWILWWNAHAIPLSARWWNAPIFYPAPSGFALSEALLGLTVITTPLQWMGVSALAASNVVFVLSWPLAALAAHILAFRLTRRHDAAFVAGLAFGFSPYRIAQMSHLQVEWACWMAFGLAALHWFHEERRPFALVCLGACWLLNGLTNGYYLVFFPVLLALWMMWFVRRWREAAAIAVTLIVASLPLIPILLGYHTRQAAFGLERGIREIESFSADLSSVFAASSRLLVASHWTLAPRAEGELYPGIVLVTVIVFGVVAAWRKPIAVHETRRIHWWLLAASLASAMLAIVVWLTDGWRVSLPGIALTAHHPSRFVTAALWLLVGAVLLSPRMRLAWRQQSPLAFYTLAAFAMLLFALGPTAYAFGYRFLYKAPYSWLLYLPGSQSLRVPARFAMLWVLCLSQAGAIAFMRRPRARWASQLKWPVLALIALDGWTLPMTTVAVPASMSVPVADKSVPVLEWPAGDDWAPETTAMWHGIEHGHPVVNGMSGYSPPHYDALRRALDRLDPGAILALRQQGPLAVFVDAARDGDGRIRAFVGALPDVQPAGADASGAWFLFPRQADRDEGAPDSSPPLDIVGVTASRDAEEARTMLDGDLRTRWTTGAKSADQTVTLDFGHPAAVTRVVLSLGRYTTDYPRHLDLEVSDGTTTTTVWSGPTTAPALSAAIRHPLETSIAIDIPTPARGRYLTLRQTDATDPKAFWSIAELRVFGR